jgi:hypothetical protein
MNEVVRLIFYFHHKDVKVFDVQNELYVHDEYILDILVVFYIFLEELEQLDFDEVFYQ